MHEFELEVFCLLKTVLAVHMNMRQTVHQMPTGLVHLNHSIQKSKITSQEISKGVSTGISC